MPCNDFKRTLFALTACECYTLCVTVCTCKMVLPHSEKMTERFQRRVFLNKYNGRLYKNRNMHIPSTGSLDFVVLGSG